MYSKEPKLSFQRRIESQKLVWTVIFQRTLRQCFLPPLVLQVGALCLNLPEIECYALDTKKKKLHWFPECTLEEVCSKKFWVQSKIEMNIPSSVVNKWGNYCYTGSQKVVVTNPPDWGKILRTEFRSKSDFSQLCSKKYRSDSNLNH